MSGFIDIANRATLELARREKSSDYLSDPVLWAEDYLGLQLWSKQKEILYSIRDNRNTAVAAGHGVGKSYVAAIAMAWWVDVHPLTETFIASTAPFQDQITTILWNNMRMLWLRSETRYTSGIVDHALPGYITGDNKLKLHNGMTIGQGRKPPDNKTDSGYQGLHATYLLAIGDEAAGLGEDMVNALGNITTGEHNRLLLIANPTDPSSAMARIWQQSLPQWNRMHISVQDSPLITREEGFDLTHAGGMSGQDYIDEMRDKFGEDDPQYITRVTGQWAFDAGNNVFTEEDLARAGNCYVLPDPEGAIYFGCDISRMGKDATYVYARQEGEVWDRDAETNRPTEPSGERGQHVRIVDSWRKAPLTGTNPENLGSAQRIHAHALALGAAVIMVDAAGLGSGVIDGLMELNTGQYVVFEVVGSVPSTKPQAFLNSRAEEYFSLKEKMFAGKLDIDAEDSELLDELRNVTYEYSTKGQRKIESKDDMKKRGKKSPDRADALYYACMDVEELMDPSYRKHGDIVGYDPDEELGLGDHPFYASAEFF